MPFLYFSCCDTVKSRSGIYVGGRSVGLGVLGVVMWMVAMGSYVYKGEGSADAIWRSSGGQ